MQRGEGLAMGQYKHFERMIVSKASCVIHSLKNTKIPYTTRSIYLPTFFLTCVVVYIFGLVILKAEVFLNSKRKLHS